MPRTKKFDREKLFNILKLLWAVAIFYLWLKLLVPTTVNESMVQENLYEWVEYSDNTDMEEELRNELWDHDAPHNMTSDEQTEALNLSTEFDVARDGYQLKFQELCAANSVFCSKVNFNGNFEYKDKYMYLASAIYVLKFIDRNIKVWSPLKNQLKTITVNSSFNSRRWFANWTTVTLNLWIVSSYTEFMELVSHELWHVVDLWVVKWSSSKKDNIYTEFGKSVFASDDPSLAYYKISWDSENIRKATASTVDFCSSYAMSDPFEDFAECHNLYLNHNALFKLWAQNNESMKKKYNFFANLYGWAYMFAATADLQKYTITSRPWDTTKM